ncbi:U5 small nuclear ribonucleoprotein, partial [Cladochytrium tenue]
MSTGTKRPADDASNSGLPAPAAAAAGGAVVKRPRDDASSALVRSSGGSGSSELVASMKKIQRTSNLQAPIILLTGHLAEVFSCKFSPDGAHIASSSFDRNILLWNTYGDCKNYNILKGHSGAVLEIQWSSDGTQIYSASTDKTLGIWDAETGARVRKLKGHGSFVNSVAAAAGPSSGAPDVLASAADDATVRVWDARQRAPTTTLRLRFATTAVALSRDPSARTLFAGGIDNI